MEGDRAVGEDSPHHLVGVAHDFSQATKRSISGFRSSRRVRRSTICSCNSTLRRSSTTTSASAWCPLAPIESGLALPLRLVQPSGLQ